MIGDVQLPITRGADGSDGACSASKLRGAVDHGGEAIAGGHRSGEELVVLVVGKEVVPLKGGHGAAVIDGATSDTETNGVRVVIDRRLECSAAGAVGVGGARRSFCTIPAIIGAGISERIERVHFLAQRAPNIADPH